MKRFHVHLSVADIGRNVEFYSRLFGLAPARREADYAKWMLDDPPLNFALSSRGHEHGLNHFGLQTDSAEELDELRAHAAEAAGGVVPVQGQVTCCYAKSEKHWSVDPQGIAWEHFRTHGDAAEFGSDAAPSDGACCIPLYTGEAGDAAARRGRCCV